jgi:CRISPR-associated endonuclease/helicase Cas3
MFAHSLPGRPTLLWEPLAKHLESVGCSAAKFASSFGFAAAAEVSGRLHDIGKASAAFQRYIRSSDASLSGDLSLSLSRVDHSTAGAREVHARYPNVLGRLLAFAVAGHHAGLADADQLSRRLDPKQTTIEPYAGWEAHAGPLPEQFAGNPQFRDGPHRGFCLAFLGRMLFSCLVDADFLETERFYAKAEGVDATAGRGGFPPLAVLAERLTAHLASVRRNDRELNRLRSRVLDAATEKAALSPGLFTLTVPTGGGKTLTSLSFALNHAIRHGLRRVIYVAPFTAIIEQTAAVFRGALGDDNAVLEHHSSFDWEGGIDRRHNARSADTAEGRDGLAKLHRAAENWDAPVVVTTAVQFFESLYAARLSRCRKLHNLAQAVIVLDEAQILPVHLLRPCLAALDELQRNYGASIVLCTATQPALRQQDEFKLGLDIPPERELAPNPPALYNALKRVAVEVRLGATDDAAIVERFAEQPQMLCIVNSRAHAFDLFQRICDQDGAVHLTTLMCPRHRRAVLDQVRQRLKDGAPVRLVATSLIEAGVDIDFAEVWRAMAGLDQIAQAAGRCNREARPTLGRVVVFTPADHKLPQELKAFQDAAAGVLRRHDDPLSLDAIRNYFRELYWIKGEPALDRATLDGKPFPILPTICERARRADFPFSSIARTFRMIDEAVASVIVPWDDHAKTVLKRIAAMDRPRSPDLRVLQQYAVPIPQKARDYWLGTGVLHAVHPALDAILCFDNLDHYDAVTGGRLDLTHRSAEANVI